MANVMIPKQLDMEEKLNRMQEDGKHEIGGDLEAAALTVLGGETSKAGKYSGKVPKMFLSNQCVFNCAYCDCRCSREDRGYYLTTPSEMARLAMAVARSSGCGVMMTSAIHRNADYTQEMLCESARIMREELGYRGYLHVKVMPGADPLLIRRTGLHANRLSVNIEVAHSAGYARIAKQKNKEIILSPMETISGMIAEAQREGRSFATSQSTQMMAGSTGEDDRTIMTLSHALYRKYKLRRIYYTAYQYTHMAKGYESEELAFQNTPAWRVTRLYQADRLIHLYGFSPDEVTPADAPMLQEGLDPKIAFALRNISMFPVEVNTADYETLLRVPGFGITHAKRILEARRCGTITHEGLAKMKIPRYPCSYFVTCGGRYQGGVSLDPSRLKLLLTGDGGQIPLFG